MPPPGQDRPPRAEYLALTEWLENEIDRTNPVNPGSKMLHRLNRTEYANAVRDLLDQVLAEAAMPAAVEGEEEEEQEEIVDQFREFIDQVNPEDFAS